jgi:hypothetical protein
MSGGLRVGETYLFSGYAKLDAKGRLEPEPQSLEPVRDIVLFTSDPGQQAAAGGFTAWKTDAKGLLYPLATNGQLRPTAVHYLGNRRRFHLPPAHVLLQAWAADREKWAEKLSQLLAQQAGVSGGIELNEVPIKKAYLRKPQPASEGDGEKVWTLNYVGQLLTAAPALSSGKKQPDGAVDEWAAQVRASPAELAKLVAAVDPPNFGSIKAKSDKYHLFAARFRLDYHTPTCAYVESLRPFADVLAGNAWYRIAVRKILAAKSCGLEQKVMEAPLSRSLMSPSGYVDAGVRVPLQGTGVAPLRRAVGQCPRAAVEEVDRRRGSETEPER